MLRTVRRRHLDEATKTGDSNEIDDRKFGMTLTKAEEFEPTATSSHEVSAASDDSKLIAADKPDRTAVTTTTDKETSQSRYYYEYAWPTKSGSGEARRASSRGRSLVPTEPNTARPPQQQHHQTDATDRQQTRNAGNSDMEDILDGFVKLLNGQSGQATFRQPLKSRINNRGPPRISDATVVLEPPAFVPMPQQQQQQQQPPQQQQQQPSVPQNKPKDPPPYPFDVPRPVRPLPPQPPNLVKPFLTGVPLPEQLVPTLVDGGSAGGGGGDHDDSGWPSSSSRRPPAHHQTAKPQQQYELFASADAAVTAERQDPVEDVTKQNETLPERTTEGKPATTEGKPVTTERPVATERPAATDGPSAPPRADDINATRVIGVQVSKIVDHLTLPVPVSPAVVDNVSSTAESATSTAPGKLETTSAGEHVTGVGSAVVVLEPSTSEEPYREDIHKSTDNRLPGKPTTPVKKTPQQSGITVVTCPSL